MNTLYIQQQGAGNGKTYGLIRKLDDPLFHEFNTFILMAKQHSVKYILYQEFLAARFNNLQIEEPHEINNKYKATLTKIHGGGDRPRQLVIRTIDSLMFAMGSAQGGGYDIFRDKVHSVAAGEFVSEVDEKTCIFCDETQDIDELYGRAILRILIDTRCTFYVVGDLLQSIMHENNAFAYLKNCDFGRKIVLTPINICRRFGAPELVNLVNRVVKFNDYGLPHVTAHACGPGSYEALYESVSPTATVAIIMAAYKREAAILEPNDFLIVSPFVKENWLARALETEIQRYWVRRRGLGTYVFLHQSEEFGPINLAESEKATRIVSIHTAKGDGRKIVFVVGLDESALLTFSGSHNLIYESLLHVAITRMKSKLFFVFKNTIDDIYNRFAANNGLTYKAFNIGVVHLLETLKQNLFRVLRPEQVAFPEVRRLTDMSHHNLRYRVLMGMMYIKFGLCRTELERVANQQIVVVKSWVDRSKKKFIPLVRMGDTFAVVEKYLRSVHAKLLTYEKNPPCVLEAIFIYYLLNIEETSYVLYKAISCFGEWSAEHHFYDEINVAIKACDKFLASQAPIKWRLSGPIKFMVDFKDFQLPSKIIGQCGDELIFIFCKTYLSEMNFNSLQTEILLYEYAHLNYKVKTVVFAMNLEEPLFISHNKFVNEHAFTIGDLFSKCLMSDFDVGMIEKNKLMKNMAALLDFNKSRPDVHEYLRLVAQSKSGTFISAGERKCAEILQKLYPNHKFVKVRPPWLQRLELDLYCEELQIAIEFNGLQHYRYVPFFHKTYGDFEAQLERDRRKKEICEKRGIKLIIIDSLIGIEERLALILSSELERRGQRKIIEKKMPLFK